MLCRWTSKQINHWVFPLNKEIHQLNHQWFYVLCYALMLNLSRIIDVYFWYCIPWPCFEFVTLYTNKNINLDNIFRINPYVSDLLVFCSRNNISLNANFAGICWKVIWISKIYSPKHTISKALTILKFTATN